MHRTILGGGLLAALAMAGAAAAGPTTAGPAAAAGLCPAATAPVNEAFIAADCSRCWAGTEVSPAGQTSGASSSQMPDQAARPRAAGPAMAGRTASATASAASAAPTTSTTWRLDWITPASPDAEMALAALPEAAERQARAATAATPAPAARPAPRGWVLEAQSGPAWHQYLGLQLGLRPTRGAAALPAGSTGWLALVEEVPAGTEGTAQARWLVRAVAGPLPLAARRATTHLQAFRMPDTSRADRLIARAWVEAPDGRVLWMSADRCASR